MPRLSAKDVSTPIFDFFLNSIYSDGQHWSMPVSVSQPDPSELQDLAACYIPQGLVFPIHTKLNFSVFRHHVHIREVLEVEFKRSTNIWTNKMLDTAVKYGWLMYGQIFEKDLDNEDHERLKVIFHRLINRLTLKMAVTTHYNQILGTLRRNLELALVNALGPEILEVDEMIEDSIVVLARENIENACTVIQNNVINELYSQMDIEHYDIEVKIKVNLGNRRYYDPVVLRVIENIPERVRLGMKGPTDKELRKNSIFSCYLPAVPRFKIILFYEKDMIKNLYQELRYYYQRQKADSITEKYRKIIKLADTFILSLRHEQSESVRVQAMLNLHKYLVLAMEHRDYTSGLRLFRTALMGLYSDVRTFEPPNIDDPELKEIALDFYIAVHVTVFKLYNECLFGPNVTMTFIFAWFLTYKTEVKNHAETYWLCLNHIIPMRITQYEDICKQWNTFYLDFLVSAMKQAELLKPVITQSDSDDEDM